MTAVLDPGTGQNADTASAAPTIIVGANGDVENAGGRKGPAQFGDQSSRLPKSKIITVSIVVPSIQEKLAWRYPERTC